MDAFFRIHGNVWKCGRCGYEVRSRESPYRCAKCRVLDKTKLDKEYFSLHDDQALNDSHKG